MVDLTDKYTKQDWFDKSGNKVNPNLAMLVNEFNNYDIFVLQGGTRSGKTYSTLEFFGGNMMKYGGVKYAAIRESRPVLKSTLVEDMKEIFTKLGIYDTKNHNKSDQIFSYNNNSLSFISGEDEGKIRGLKSDVLYINEAPELSWEPVSQLLMRNTSKVIFDYNPSYPESWMYDRILTRDNVAFLKTTYKDNPFVTQKQLEELEWMRENDPERYKVFGSGERGEKQGQVYNNFISIKDDEFPDDANVYAVDFGWHPDPTAILQMKFVDRQIYAREIAYHQRMGVMGIFIFLFINGFRDGFDTLIADGADPRSISELRYGIDTTEEALIEFCADLEVLDLVADRIPTLKEYIADGIAVVGSLRGRNETIRPGIRRVKEHVVKLTESSRNAWLEYSNYVYKVDRFTGESTGTPIDKHNHLMDCLRMATLARGRFFD